MGSAAQVVNAYLAAFATGDIDTARTLVADDFRFHGPFLQTAGRDAFFTGAVGLAPITRGHRLLRQWEDGDEVCSIYELQLETPTGDGAVVMTEWHTITDDRLLRTARLVFDTAEFRELVPARPDVALTDVGRGACP